MAREDTFEHERAHLAGLTDEQLEARFWTLAREITDPLVAMAAQHTSPSIERSVLMRMGIDTQTGAAVVAECETRGLLGHGAGHVVLVCMKEWGVEAPVAAARLVEGDGWDVVEAKWGGGSK